MMTDAAPAGVKAQAEAEAAALTMAAAAGGEYDEEYTGEEEEEVADVGPSSGGADPADAALFSGCVALMVAASERAEATRAASWGEQPQAASRESRPAPFLSKLTQILQTDDYVHIVHWGESEASSNVGARFVIEDPVAFSKQVLPRFFKHNKLSSFIQQLYTYGFRRLADNAAALRMPVEATSPAISFHHPLFRPDSPELLLQIRRNSQPAHANASNGHSVTEEASPSSGTLPHSGSESSIHGSLKRSRSSEDDEPMTGGSIVPYTPAASSHSYGSADEEVAELLAEVDTLEAAIDGLKQMQSERYATDAMWLDEMMMTVQAHLLRRAQASRASGAAVPSSSPSLAPSLPSAAVPTPPHLAALPPQRVLYQRMQAPAPDAMRTATPPSPMLSGLAGAGALGGGLSSTALLSGLVSGGLHGAAGSGAYNGALERLGGEAEAAAAPRRGGGDAALRWTDMGPELEAKCASSSSREKQSATPPPVVQAGGSCHGGNALASGSGVGSLVSSLATSAAGGLDMLRQRGASLLGGGALAAGATPPLLSRSLVPGLGGPHVGTHSALLGSGISALASERLSAGLGAGLGGSLSAGLGGGLASLMGAERLGLQPDRLIADRYLAGRYLSGAGAGMGGAGGLGGSGLRGFGARGP